MQTVPERIAAERTPSALSHLYLVVALLAAIALSILTPPFLVSDEGAHAEREISMAHGYWLALHTSQGIGAPVDTHLIQVVNDFRAIQDDVAARYPIARHRPDGRIPLALLASEKKIEWSHRLAFASFSNTAAYPATLYLPQMIGWRLAEAWELTILHSLLLVRLLTAVCCIAVGWLALRLCRFERRLLFAYLLLPTVIGLAASASQDALLVVIAALVAAILSRAIADRRTLTRVELPVATLLLAACIMARPPYLPMALLLLLPSLQAGGWSWRRLLTSSLAIILLAASVASWQRMTPATDSYKASQVSTDGVNPTLQMDYLRAHPVRGALTILKGTAVLAPNLAVKATYTLGWNDIYPPWFIYGLLLLSLAGFVLLASWSGMPSWYALGLLAFSLLAVILGISFAEYLIWTPVGAHKLEGPLARYYLPLVPFVLLLSSEHARAWKNATARRWTLSATMALFLVAVCTTPWVVARRNYSASPARVAQTALR
jgi:uncharacterized membrane protein